MTCHAGGTEHMNAINSVHTKNDVSCISCHSPHHATTAGVSAGQGAARALLHAATCNRKPQFEMPFHHRVNEGLVQCSDCHNPHGTVAAKQVRTSAAQDAVCLHLPRGQARAVRIRA